MDDFATFAPLFTGGRFGLFADFDGTLSAIAPTPDAARITPRNRELLTALRDVAALVAVVSGRGAADLAQRVGIDGLVYVGNHGLEEWVDGRVVPVPQAAPYTEAVSAAAAALGPLLLPGMHIEDKGVTLSLHYRATEDPDKAREQLLPQAQRIADANGLTLFEGRRIIELRPPITIDKGVAFERLVRQHQLDAAVFIGDDTTDVAAFQAAQVLRENGECRSYALGVVAAESPPEVAAYANGAVSSVEGVEAFIAWSLSKLSASST